MSKLRSDELVNMEGDGAPSFPQSAITIEPTADNQVATKSYVDLALSAASGNVVSETAPANPALGSFWTDTSVTPSLLKTWNGSMWIEFAGEGVGFTGAIGSPVEVLTPLNGAGVGGAYTFTPQTDDISEVKTILDYGRSDTAGINFNSFAGLAYGNGTYVILTTNDGAKYSTDGGLTWTPSAWVGGTGWTAVCWNGSVFVAVSNGSGTKIAISTDGTSWTPSGSNPNCSFMDVDADPVSGKIVAVGHSNTSDEKAIWYSTNDGASFSYAPIGGYWIDDSHLDFDKVAYGGGRWVALVSAHRSTGPAYSTNGTSWNLVQTRLSNVNNSWDELLYDSDQGRFVAFQTYASSSSPRLYSYTSYNGSSWTDHEFGFSSAAYDVTSNNGIAYVNGVYIFIPWSQTGYYYTTAAQGLNNWSRDSSGFYYNGSENCDAVVTSNGRFWIYDGSNLVKQPETTYGQRPNSMNVNDRPYFTAKFDLLTLSSTNIYDASDGSLVSDLTLADVFPATIDSGRSSAGGPVQAFHNLDGTTLTVNNGGGFTVGGRIDGNGQLTEYGPSPSEIVFTSQNAGTTPVSATDATVSFRKWTLETRASSSDPWTVVTESDDYDIAAGQDGSTPWSSSPTLQPNTAYRVKVSYYSDNAEPVESVYSTFETGPA